MEELCGPAGKWGGSGFTGKLYIYAVVLLKADIQ